MSVMPLDKVKTQPGLLRKLGINSCLIWVPCNSKEELESSIAALSTDYVSTLLSN